MKPFVDTCIRFFKKETVLCVAGILAFISAFFVHPSAAYIGYIDFRVLSLLFSINCRVVRTFVSSAEPRK